MRPPSRSALLGAATLIGAQAIVEEAWLPSWESESDATEDARLGSWRERAHKPVCLDDECSVGGLATAGVAPKARMLTQINRGRLGNHLFQWAALLSIAKEAGMQVAVRDLKYKPNSTAQMSGLKPLVWEADAYSTLEKRDNLCHVWDSTPIIVDTGLPRLSMWSGWGQEKGTTHIATGINPQYGQNWAKLWARAMVNSTLPSDSTCETWELDGFFQQQWFFAEHMSLVREAFWHEPSAAQAAEALKWLMYNEKGASVGLHIRLGDYKYTNRNMPIQYYQDALKEVAKRNANTTLTCVIFSDDIPEAMAMTDVLTQCTKRIPVPPDLGEAHSFYMLGIMPNIVIADSSFSFWAARLAPHEPFVIAPGIYKDSSNAQSAYEYLLQTPGWLIVNTTTDMMNKVANNATEQAPAAAAPAAAMLQLRRRVVPEGSAVEAARNEEFTSEWAY